MKNENLKIVEKRLPKLLVMGYGRHGKDTVCELLRDHLHFKFVSSSFFMAEKVVYPALAQKYGYATVEDCYEDRHKHRGEWFDLIAATNRDDAATLGKAIFKEYDIYCGLRNIVEYHAMLQQKVFDYSIWVDATDRGIPPESLNSCTVHEGIADIVIYNNHTKADLEAAVVDLGKKLIETHNK